MIGLIDKAKFGRVLWDKGNHNRAEKVLMEVGLHKYPHHNLTNLIKKMQKLLFSN